MDDTPAEVIDRDVLPGVAMAIGTLCQNWADLEHGAVLLLGALSGMKRDAHTLAILRCFGFRDQLTAIKMAASCRVSNEGLADLIIDAVDYVDNILRPRRNRIVHDRWSESATGRLEALRWDMTPRLQRAQSRVRPALVEPQPTTEPFVEVLRASAEVGAYGEYLCSLAVAVIQPSPGRLDELLGERPQRPYPLRL